MKDDHSNIKVFGIYNTNADLWYDGFDPRIWVEFTSDASLLNVFEEHEVYQVVMEGMEANVFVPEKIYYIIVVPIVINDTLKVSSNDISFCDAISVRQWMEEHYEP